MGNQEIHTPIESHKAPQKPEPTTEHAMSKRRFLGAIGAITAAAAMGVLTNACRRDERETEELTLQQQFEKRELSPEETEKIIDLLKTRWEAEKNRDLCPYLNWRRVEKALRAVPKKLWSVNMLERLGHEPTIYFADVEGFDIGTRTDETPLTTKLCTYDEEPQWLKERYPNEQFSAKGRAGAMGVNLMTVEQSRHIVRNTDPYDEIGLSYYDTPEDVRKAGDALCGGRNGDYLSVRRVPANVREDYDRGWRGTLRVNYVD